VQFILRLFIIASNPILFKGGTIDVCIELPEAEYFAFNFSHLQFAGFVVLGIFAFGFDVLME